MVDSPRAAADTRHMRRSVGAGAGAGQLCCPSTPPSIGSPFGFHPRFPQCRVCSTSSTWPCWRTWARWFTPPPGPSFSNGRRIPPEPVFARGSAGADADGSLDGNGQTGWAGRTADKIQSIYDGNFPIIISLAGTNIFCEGLVARSIESSGDPTKLLSGFGGSAESQSRLSALQNLLTFDTGLSLIQSASTTTTNALQNRQDAGGCPGGRPSPGQQFPAEYRYFASQLQAGGADHFRCALRWGYSGRSSSFRWAALTPTPTNLPSRIPFQRSECRDERVLPGHRRNGCSLASHRLHLVGLRPHLLPRTATAPTTRGAATT